MSHAPAFFFPQAVAAAGGACVATGRITGPPDWEEFAAAIDRHTTLAIVNTPVNPTGYVFRPHDLDAIVEALAGSAALLLSDEAYVGLVYDGLEHVSPASHPELHGRTIVLRSFSKTHAMAAWRVGYAVGPTQAIERMAHGARVAGARGRRRRPGRGARRADRPAGMDRDSPRRARRDAAARGRGGERDRRVAGRAPGRRRVRLGGGRRRRGGVERPPRPRARHHGAAGRHFAALLPHLRIPFGGRPDAREALLERLADVR